MKIDWAKKIVDLLNDDPGCGSRLGIRTHESEKACKRCSKLTGVAKSGFCSSTCERAHKISRMSAANDE